LINKICLDKSIDEAAIKELALEIIINIIERVPSIIKNNDSLVQIVFDLLLNHMISIENQIEDEWIKPKEGFDINADDSSNTMVRFAIGALDRCMSAG